MHVSSEPPINPAAVHPTVQAPRLAAWLALAVVLSLSCARTQEGGTRFRVAEGSAQREFVIELGPVDLPARASHHDVPQPAPLAITLPIDGWLRGFNVELADGRGSLLPRKVLHHVNLIVPGKRELFSPIMLRIGAAGPETKPVQLPRLLGYRVRPGDSLLVTAMLHNPGERAYHGARLRVRMPYTPSGGWLSPVSIYPFYMDVMPPAGRHAYDLPPGRSAKSWEARPAIPGRILGIGGHLHRYGVALRFEDVTAREVIWEAAPVVDAHGNVVEMPSKTFLGQLGIPVRPDHVYRLTAIYDNPTGRAIPEGAMGALGGVFVPDRAADWPAADLRDPEYRLDGRITRGGGGKHRHEGGSEAESDHRGH